MVTAANPIPNPNPSPNPSLNPNPSPNPNLRPQRGLRCAAANALPAAAAAIISSQGPRPPPPLVPQAVGLVGGERHVVGRLARGGVV